MTQDEIKPIREKLTFEFYHLLNDTLKAFVKLNKFHDPKSEYSYVSNAVFDGSFAFMATIIKNLLNVIDDENERIEVIEESRAMFNAYLDDIKKMKVIHDN